MPAAWAARTLTTTTHALQPDATDSSRALPFGAVMATAGAAALAEPCGLGWLTAPLLALAIAQAAWIAATTVLPHRNTWRALPTWLLTVRRPREHSGAHTVPLGLAIISSTLAGLGFAGGRLVATPWPSGAFLLLAWLAGGVCIVRFGLALIQHPWHMTDVDGAWFLVPAVPLGLAIATADVAAHATGMPHTALAWLALVAGVAGWVSYWLVAAAAGRRVYVHGLGLPPHAPWWIAMGCAGLAAAALGKVLDTIAWPSTIQTPATFGILIAAFGALALMLPVIALSLRFLLRDCRCRNAAAWPPTFSTAVFALGCLAASATRHATWWHVLGLVGGYATLALWAATLGWSISRRLRRLA